MVIVSFAPIHPCGSLGTPQGVLVAMPLKGFAEQLLLEYEEKNILPVGAKENLKQTIKILYEMQPKIFTSLNTEQKKILVGLLGILLESNKTETIAQLLGGIMALLPNLKNFTFW